jgi:nudix-type nucleoside diphosphatase (YffH/AdpP family)
MVSGKNVRSLRKTLLARNWGSLARYDFEFLTRSGEWRHQSRESYDHGSGVACLLFDPDEDTVLLVRQFRLPVSIAGEEGHIIEVPAGLLEGDTPEDRMRTELLEETGYRPETMEPVVAIFTSPGACTERLILFRGTYRRHGGAAGPGGGRHDEGEDIEVLHVNFDEALAMVRSGKITDAKTVILLQHLALERVGLF